LPARTASEFFADRHQAAINNGLDIHHMGRADFIAKLPPHNNDATPENRHTANYFQPLP
jgi:hypothetical protein